MCGKERARGRSRAAPRGGDLFLFFSSSFLTICDYVHLSLVLPIVAYELL